MVWVLLFVAIFVIVFTIAGLKIIQQSETMVIERLGKYHRTLQPGINIIWPIFDRAREIQWKKLKETYDGATVIKKYATVKIDLRETVYDFPKQNVITKDNVILEINALLYFQVVDPMRSIYEISNLPDAIEKLTQTTLRNVIGEMELDETLISRDVINKKLREILDETTDKWGIKVNRVELQDIVPPIDIKEAMEKQMRAERDRRAAILEAEGLKRSSILQSEGIRESEVNRAEGIRKSKILTAEGEAQAIKKIAEALEKCSIDPATYFLAVKYIETLKEMVSGKDNKVIYLPYEATGILGSIGSIKELFQK